MDLRRLRLPRRADETALNIGLIYAVCPAGIALVGVTLLHERMSWAQRAAAMLALSGVVYVVAKGDLENLRALRLTPGDGWIVAAAIAWVAYSVLLSRWKLVLGPAPRLAATIAGGLLACPPFTLAEMTWIETPPWSWKATGLVVAAAVLPGALSYSAYSFVQRELGVVRTGLMMYLAPLYAPLLGWLLLDEPPRRLSRDRRLHDPAGDRAGHARHGARLSRAGGQGV